MYKPADMIRYELDFSRNDISSVFSEDTDKFLRFRGPWLASDLYYSIGFETAYDARQFAEDCVESGYFRKEGNHYLPTDGLMEALHAMNEGINDPKTPPVREKTAEKQVRDIVLYEDMEEMETGYFCSIDSEPDDNQSLDDFPF